MILNWQIGTKWASFFRIWLVYLHHIVVSKTTLGCTAAYNANTPSVFHTGKFWPVSKLLQYDCRQTATKWAKFFLLRTQLVYLWKKVKRQNLMFVYTLHHIVVSQTTLPVFEPTACVIQPTVCIQLCTALGQFLWASHHAPYIIVEKN